MISRFANQVSSVSSVWIKCEESVKLSIAYFGSMLLIEFGEGLHGATTLGNSQTEIRLASG